MVLDDLTPKQEASVFFKKKFQNSVSNNYVRIRTCIITDTCVTPKPLPVLYSTQFKRRNRTKVAKGVDPTKINNIPHISKRNI